MKNLIKNKVQIVKKSTKREDAVLRCGSRITTITFPKDPKKKGEATYRIDHSLTPEVREIREAVATIDKGTTWLKEN